MLKDKLYSIILAPKTALKKIFRIQVPPHVVLGELRHAATTGLLRVTGVCEPSEAVPSASLNMVREA